MYYIYLEKDNEIDESFDTIDKLDDKIIEKKVGYYIQKTYDVQPKFTDKSKTEIQNDKYLEDGFYVTKNGSIYEKKVDRGYIYNDYIMLRIGKVIFKEKIKKEYVIKEVPLFQKNNQPIKEKEEKDEKGDMKANKRILKTSIDPIIKRITFNNIIREYIKETNSKGDIVEKVKSVKKIYEILADNQDFPEYLGSVFLMTAYKKLIEFDEYFNKRENKDELLAIFNPMEYIKSTEVFKERWYFDQIKIVN